MQQPSRSDSGILLDVLREQDAQYRHYVTQYEDRQKKAEQGLEKPLTQHLLDMMEKYRNLIKTNAARRDQIQRHDHTFGNVYAASGLKLDPQRLNHRDWALIRLDNARFNQIPSNSVSIHYCFAFRRSINTFVQLPSSTFTEQEILLINENLDDADKLNGIDFPFKVSGIVPVNEIVQPKVVDGKGFQTFRVVKFGRSTHWTAGVSNEIHSCCSYPGFSTISTEWCVIDVNGASRFSQPGDSGSAVFDYRGRIAGILHGAGICGKVGRTTTYVTPFEWVLQDIESTLACTVRI